MKCIQSITYKLVGKSKKIIRNTRIGYFKFFSFFPTFARKKFGIVDPRTYGQILPILGQKGLFWVVLGQLIAISGQSKRSKPIAPELKYIYVQPMFNPFGVAGTAYGQINPFWAKNHYKLAINGHKIWQMGSLKVEHFITQPNKKIVCIGFWRLQHFLNTPPLST